MIMDEGQIKQKTEILRFKVDLLNLFREIAEHSEIRGVPGAVFGLEIIQKCPYKMAQRAIEIEDGVILEELEAMGVIHPIEEQEEKGGP